MLKTQNVQPFDYVHNEQNIEKEFVGMVSHYQNLAQQTDKFQNLNNKVHLINY